MTLQSLALQIFEAFVIILLILSLSFNQSLLNLGDSIDFGNFSVRGYFNPKGFYYSYAWSHSLDVSLENSADYVFNWLYFTYCLTSFSSVDHLLHLYAQILILFHLTYMRFSRSTHLQMCLSLETLASIISTC